MVNEIEKIRRKPIRKIYWKVYDFFVREFKWPEQLLRYSHETLPFKMDYNLTFEDNMKRLKKKFNLTDDEYKDFFERCEPAFIIHQLELSDYANRKMLNRIYKTKFSEKSVEHFLFTLDYLIKYIDSINEKNFNFDKYHQHRVLINILLGISFEYSCKVLLLSKGYIINEIKVDNKNLDKPVKNLPLNGKLIELKTISLDKAWNFLKKEELIELNKDEISSGNYLNYLRNVQSHVPLLIASRGTYNNKCIKLIKKIVESIDEYRYIKYM